MKVIFETQARKTEIKTEDDDADIYELMNILYDSLKAMTFSDQVILNGLKHLKKEIEK
jgi:hypothetical protein